MARRIRETDWQGTALGPPDGWPAPLRTCVEILLRIGFPGFLWWGTEHDFSNDAAGGPWPTPAAARRVLATGETICETALVPAAGGARVCLVSFSPVGGPGPPGGVLAIAGPSATAGPQPSELQRVLHGTLSVLRSITRGSARPGIAAVTWARHLDGRLAAVARVHNALVRDPAAGIDLGLLLVDTLGTTGARESRDFSLSGPALALTGRRAETLGIALHELATNAATFGALAHRGARVAVRWRVESDGNPPGPRLLIDWDETGVAHRPGPRPRRGFGTDYLERSLAGELGARVSHRLTRDGLECRIDLPLTG